LLQVRLADRRGLLHGTLNQVQNYALKLLMMHEAIEAAQTYDRRQGDTLRQRIATSDVDRFYAVIYPPPEDEAASKALEAAVGADGAVDPTKIDFDSVPNSPAPRSDEEREQLKRWIENIGSDSIGGTVTGDELVAEPTWREWQ
jgi:hypothetical protein